MSEIHDLMFMFHLFNDEVVMLSFFSFIQMPVFAQSVQITRGQMGTTHSAS